MIPPSSPGALPQNADVLYTINSPVNGTGASLKGVEIALQTTFRFLPGFLRDFGAIASATLIDSDATYVVQGPTVNPCVRGATAAAACAFGRNVSTTRNNTLFGLSKRQYNGTHHYEHRKFSARGSISYRGPYVDQNSATGNILEG